MSRRRIPIFYEDDRGSVKGFGLHELLVACIADHLDQDQTVLRERFEAIPKKGDSKLGSSRPSHDELLAELRRRCPDERLHMYLLVSNTETVVNAVADCLKQPRPDKDKLLRDQLLSRAAWSPTRELRDCVRRAVPSFEQCVCAIASLT